MPTNLLGCHHFHEEGSHTGLYSKRIVIMPNALYFYNIKLQSAALLPEEYSDDEQILKESDGSLRLKEKKMTI